MTLAQLRYAITVAGASSMNEAARKLFISQPSLSAAIKELEEEVGVELFKRTNRGISVTLEGEEFIGYARQVVEQYNLIESKYILKENTKKKFGVSMQHYTFAVKAFVEMVKQFGMDEYEFEIGSYRGFSLFVNFNPFERDIILRGALLYGTDIGNSGQGTITRIENLAERIPNYLEDARRELKETQKQLAVAQQQVGQPFLYEEELSEKVAQLTEINTKLEFESLQESEVILDENGQRSDGEEDWDSERVPACASAEV